MFVQAKLAQAGPCLPWAHPGPGLTDPSCSDPAVGTDSSSLPVQLTSVPVVGQWMYSEGVGCQPWDLDPAEITICKRPDGSDWLLGVGSFGQVSETPKTMKACDKWEQAS